MQGVERRWAEGKIGTLTLILLTMNCLYFVETVSSFIVNFMCHELFPELVYIIS